MSEEEEARDYCLHHPLARPKINAMITFCVFVLGENGVRVLAEWSWGKACAGFNLDIAFWAWYGIVSFLAFVLLGLWIAILLVLLYQRYAPETTRRKCTCKPSCSEYALVAFRKYGVFRGGYKVYIRLTRICGNGRYVIDYP